MALVEDYPILLLAEDSDRGERGKVIHVLCSLCLKHKTDQRNHAGMWTSKPCTCICRDMVDRHSKSAMHREAVKKEALFKWCTCDDGIVRALEKQITAQRNVVVASASIS